jgi:hypothetical protein
MKMPLPDRGSTGDPDEAEKTGNLESTIWE